MNTDTNIKLKFISNCLQFFTVNDMCLETELHKASCH